MQAALQAFVDNSLSKTVNFPEDATEEDVARVYQLAWELGCKGITVYVTGSRQKVVLETKATARQKEAVPAAAVESAFRPHIEQMPMWYEKKKPRPRSLRGYTYNISTPLGKAFITINENGGEQPFEIFINTSKAGSDTAAVSEAIGRLISYIFRLASPVEPRERLKEVWRQLSGIGGGRSLGFGPNRVRSLPDGVSQVLAEYLEATDPSQYPLDMSRRIIRQASSRSSLTWALGIVAQNTMEETGSTHAAKPPMLQNNIHTRSVIFAQNAARQPLSMKKVAGNVMHVVSASADGGQSCYIAQ